MRSLIPAAEPVPSRRGAVARIARVALCEAGLRAGELAGRHPLPRTPEQITPEWLTDALCREAPGGRVTAVSAPERASSGTTTRGGLKLSLNETAAAAAVPERVFVKCTSTLSQRLMLGMGGLIGGEPGFYEHVRPRLEIEAPAGFFGTVDPRSWRSVVVMEDVAQTRGARFGSAAPLGRPEIEELLTTAARWHGALWEDPALAGRWPWLRTPADQGRLIGSLIGLADRTGAGTRRASAVIPAGLGERRTDLIEGMRRSLTRLGEPPHTYLHGDLHVGNTYTTVDGRIGVCDWQVAMRGGWAHDVTYLLVTSLEVDDRRAWERALLEHYLARLREFGGEPPEPDAAWEAYRHATLYPYFAWIYTLGRSRLQPRFQAHDMALTLIARIGAAIEDLDSLGAVGL